MFKDILFWVYSKDYTFWQNVGQLAVIIIIGIAIFGAFGK